MADIPELAGRLKSTDPRVRRIAVMDLVRAGEPGLVVLLEHLPSEGDQKAAILIIRALGEGNLASARQTLAGLRDNPSTPVRVYHAATLAHDRLARAELP